MCAPSAISLKCYCVTFFCDRILLVGSLLICTAHVMHFLLLSQRPIGADPREFCEVSSENVVKATLSCPWRANIHAIVTNDLFISRLNWFAGFVKSLPDSR
jgi:hypothetical protein